MVFEFKCEESEKVDRSILSRYAIISDSQVLNDTSA